MNRYIVFIPVVVIILMLAVGASSAQSKPLVITFVKAPTDPEIASVTAEQFRKTDRVDVLAFNPNLPAVVRAVMENHITQDIVNGASDPKNAMQLAGALGAQYVLQIKGTVADSKVDVTLELLKVPSGGRWETTMGSNIQPGGPRPALNRSNAILTAAGSAVSQIVILAFTQGALTSANPQTNESTITLPAAPIASEDAGTARDIVAEYVELIKQVDAYVIKRDLPNAIVTLRKAINLEPDKSAPRLRLAQIYMDMGMMAEAVEECNRALLFQSNDLAVYNQLAKLYIANGAPAEAAAQCKEIVRLDPQNIDARLTLGDLYWNQAKLDDAMNTYQEVVKLAPENPAPHERLQRLYAARKMYTPALEHLLQARLLSAGTGLDDAGRYRIIAQLMQDEFNVVVGKLKAVSGMSREDYYQECKDATNRIDALASFLSTQTAPGDYKGAHSHGVLGVSLLAQTSGYMVSYLETEKRSYIDQAKQFQTEAETEMRLFSGAVLKI